MTAPSTTAPAGRLTDEDILRILVARLERVDAELPRTAPWHGERATRLRVVRARRAPAARLAHPLGPAQPRPALRVRTEPILMLAAVVVLALVAAGRWVVPSGQAVPDAGASPSSTAPAPSPSSLGSSPVVPPPSAGPATSPSATSPTPVADAAEAAAIQVQRRLGWACAVLVRVADEPLADGLIRKLELTDPLDGFVPGDLGPIWAGRDPAGAARAFKGRLLLADEAGTAWIVRGGDSRVSALRLSSQRSPGGTILWRPGDVLWPLDCRTTTTDVKSLLANGRAADWPVTGQVIDVGIVRLPADPSSRAR